MSIALREDFDVEVKPCVQTFTFGQHRKTDLGNGHRPLWRYRQPDAPLYPDQIKVPSWRQLNGDKRAAAGGRVPLDTDHFEQFTTETQPLPNLSFDDINRLLSKIQIGDSDDCWEWTAGTRNGYGRMRVGRKLLTATRLIWRLVHGTDPVGQLLLHTCDNPSCCNPAHLFLGSHADNNHDKERKKRGNHPLGEKVGTSKLTESDVRGIYRSQESNRDLAARFDVSDVTIRNIKTGQIWQHVTQDPMSDVFNFPRVTGNSKQRRKWWPTQLNEGLVERCIKLSTQEGDHVVDPFGGTGTTLRVCRRTGRRCTLIERSNFAAVHIAAEHELSAETFHKPGCSPAT